MTPDLDDLRAAFAAVRSFHIGGRFYITRGYLTWTVGDEDRVAEAAGRLVADPMPSNRSKEHMTATRFDFRKAVAVARRVAACYSACDINVTRLDALDRIADLVEPT